ncbi:MAG: serine hydrolase domain-containing protein [Spirochaetia bacterium]
MNKNKKSKIDRYNLSQKKWIRIIVTAAITLGIILPAAKPGFISRTDRELSVEEFTRHLDILILKRMRRYGVAGVSAALIHGGKTVWVNAYGYGDVKNGIKMTPNTVCRVESISKSVTAWGVMKLAEEGKINLDAPVSQYLTDWTWLESDYNFKEITVRMLLSNQSGLPEGDYTNRHSPASVNLPPLRKTVAEQSIILKQPGSTFLYSNVGFNLLEILIEDVTGRPFSEYMQEEILTPLGMNNSSFQWNSTWNPPVPKGYTVEGEEIDVYVYPEKGSGGLFADAADIARFTSAGMFRPGIPQNVLTMESLRAMYVPVTELSGYYRLVFQAYGLGHLVETVNTGETAVAHGGQGAGVMTHFHSVPETGDGIVILSNSQRSWPFFAEILKSWASWRGFSAGMERMMIGQTVLWFLIGLILFLSFWRMWGIGAGITFRDRIFAPFSKTGAVSRVIKAVCAGLLIAAFFWSISQPYFFLFSVFPVASYWLLFALLAAAAVLSADAALPSVKQR